MDHCNFLKVVPLWRISGAMSHDQSHGPNGGLPILVLTSMEAPERHDAPTVLLRSLADWAESLRDNTEVIFKELNWELSLEGS